MSEESKTSAQQIRIINEHQAHIAVIGAGAFGCALAASALGGGCRVTIFSQTAAKKAALTNDPILSKCQFQVEDGSQHDFAAFDLVLIAVSTQALRSVCQWMKATLKEHYGSEEQTPPVRIICASKGIERGTLKLPCEIIQECLPPNTEVGALSGPSFAAELRAGLPGSVVLATRSPKLRELGTAILHRSSFRIYDSEDLIGVEIAGALKNVIAIVAGGCDGFKLGNNARAAVITRGFGEIVQLGVRLGAEHITFLGLSGLGDLLLTCTGDLSRNRQFGLRVASGESVESIVSSMGQVIEGITTAESTWRISQRLGLDTPVLDTAYHVLYGQMPARNAVQALMSRSHKGEFDWMRR